MRAGQLQVIQWVAAELHEALDGGGIAQDGRGGHLETGDKLLGQSGAGRALVEEGLKTGKEGLFAPSVDLVARLEAQFDPILLEKLGVVQIHHLQAAAPGVTYKHK